MDEAKPNLSWITLAVMLATFMEVLDTSIANVALSHIAGSLAVSNDDATWVLTTYLISNAIIIPSTAWFGQRFGRKRFLLICVATFTATSFLCGMSANMPMLLLMRVIQGASGGALQPIAQAVLFESYPKEKQGQAMGIYGLGIVVAPILGPVLGGWITDSYSWRWIFFINVPVGVIALLLMHRFIEDPPWVRNAHPAPLDKIGFGFMSMWLGCQEVVLDKGQEDDWFGSPFIILMAVLAAIGLVGFLVRVFSSERPFVDLRILKNYNFGIGVGLVFFFGVALYGLTAAIPLYTQALMGYTALWSGLVMVPRGFAALLAMPLAGKLVGKIQGGYLVAGGFLLTGFAAILLSRITLAISPWNLFWPLFISGLSIGFQFVPLNTVALGSLKPEQMGNASGIFNLMRNVGGSVGISLVTTLAERRAQAHQTFLVAHVTPYDLGYRSTLQTLGPSLAHHVGTVTGFQKALGLMYQNLLTQAGLLAYMDTFRFFALLSVSCVVAALFLKRIKVTGPIRMD